MMAEAVNTVPGTVRYRTLSKGKIAEHCLLKIFFIFRLHFDPVISKYDLSRQPVMILEKGKKNCPHIFVCIVEVWMP
jgi:hypothetical protein